MTTNCQPCTPECESVFDRVVVSYLIKGGARVMWTLLPTFLDPLPLTFQLQVGSTSSNDSDDWEDVGLPVENQYVAIDPDQRVWGKTNWTHYRVKVTSSNGVYYSTPTSSNGTLSRRDWLFAREHVRQRRLLYRVGFGAQKGYLLKRRWTGEPCPICLDLQTRECRDPSCPVCYGTGFQCGYFFPMNCIWATTSPKSTRTERDGGQSRGTIDDVIVKAEMLLTDLLDEEDIWVNAATDDRWFIHRVTHIAEVRGVPIIGEVELRLVPFSHIIYTIEIPDQIAALEA